MDEGIQDILNKNTKVHLYNPCQVIVVATSKVYKVFIMMQQVKMLFLKDVQLLRSFCLIGINTKVFIPVLKV